MMQSFSYRLEPAAAGTRLANNVEVKPASASLALIGAVAVPRVKAAVARNLEVLRRLLESTAPVDTGARP